jgi:hypothetical protein
MIAEGQTREYKKIKNINKADKRNKKILTMVIASNEFLIKRGIQ